MSFSESWLRRLCLVFVAVAACDVEPSEPAEDLEEFVADEELAVPEGEAFSEEPSWSESFAAPGARPSAVKKGLGGSCYGSCNCEIGLYCEGSNGSQQGICSNLVFSPAPPIPPTACFGSCQCPTGKSCVFNGGAYGTCTDPKPGKCISDCDCGVTRKCVAGQCQADFGPYPGCRCSKHCPYNGQCSGGFCQ